MTRAICNEKAVRDVIKMMFDAMPAEKRAVYDKAINRQVYLTSYGQMSRWCVSVYMEGFYIEGEGCRCRFAAWAFDRDGELVFGRKPKEDKLNLIWCGSTANADY